ncbi:hypothetical protein CAC42_2308 [Sphaceloma murrayae]|uniref:Uncharacterized protein n=1 Tax=Sphaceloma murrayae TaxID=2082308 RepID=A0A2K1QJK9_9PEZI|nr:hypothetical protein CAC42_2308 [Sphaceloma murrayae]
MDPPVARDFGSDHGWPILAVEIIEKHSGGICEDHCSVYIQKDASKDLFDFMLSDSKRWRLPRYAPPAVRLRDRVPWLQVQFDKSEVEFIYSKIDPDRRGIIDRDGSPRFTSEQLTRAVYAAWVPVCQILDVAMSSDHDGIKEVARKIIGKNDAAALAALVSATSALLLNDHDSNEQAVRESGAQRGPGHPVEKFAQLRIDSGTTPEPQQTSLTPTGWTPINGAQVHAEKATSKQSPRKRVRFAEAVAVSGPTVNDEVSEGELRNFEARFRPVSGSVSIAVKPNPFTPDPMTIYSNQTFLSNLGMALKTSKAHTVHSRDTDTAMANYPPSYTNQTFLSNLGKALKSHSPSSTGASPRIMESRVVKLKLKLPQRNKDPNKTDASKGKKRKALAGPEDEDSELEYENEGEGDDSHAKVREKGKQPAAGESKNVTKISHHRRPKAFKLASTESPAKRAKSSSSEPTSKQSDSVEKFKQDHHTIFYPTKIMTTIEEHTEAMKYKGNLAATKKDGKTDYGHWCADEMAVLRYLYFKRKVHGAALRYTINNWRAVHRKGYPGRAGKPRNETAVSSRSRVLSKVEKEAEEAGLGEDDVSSFGDFGTKEEERALDRLCFGE